ncbi:hypothetical protein [Streptomyces mirabilis]|uniref:hypothetical protein n=1 Tax=Streptomyces mirabilis TaxID=68239 RepID=UPI0033BD571D
MNPNKRASVSSGDCVAGCVEPVIKCPLLRALLGCSTLHLDSVPLAIDLNGAVVLANPESWRRNRGLIAHYDCAVHFQLIPGVRFIRGAIAPRVIA